MWLVKEFGTVLSTEQTSRLTNIDTAAVCDALAELKIATGGCMQAELKSMSRAAKLIGAAYTVKAEHGNSFPVHYAIYNALPGYVLTVDTGSYTAGPYLGGLMLSNAKNMGLSGVLVDGYVRDAGEVKQSDYPVFCRGFMPKKPGKERVGEINTAIVCGGITINPGDVIFGDADGVVVIPRAALDTVLETAECKLQADKKRQTAIDEFFADNYCNACGKDILCIVPKDIQAVMKKTE